jgi:putative DNA methylase
VVRPRLSRIVEGNEFEVKKVAADPAWFKGLMALAGIYDTRVPNLYGYDRAYQNQPKKTDNPLTILDPTSGGGSIPFEALRLGHKVIANELNPVASVILHATLEYPAKYGKSLLEEIQYWGDKLLSFLDEKLDSIFSRKHALPQNELVELKDYLKKSPDLIDIYNKENTTSYLYCRQVTCPHCNGDAPLLNTCWLSKLSGKQWGVKIIPDGKPNNGTVRFETYRIFKEKGPKGEDPGFATVNRGVGHCIHCKQAIDADEIKSQARGESTHRKMERSPVLRRSCPVSTKAG